MSKLFRSRDNGWIKFYTNHTHLCGYDRDIASGKCSWSRSKLDSLIACRLQHNNLSLQITGTGNYWQSDDLEVVMIPNETTKPKWITRRLQKQIEPTDKLLIVQKPTRNNQTLILHVQTLTSGKNLRNIEDTYMFQENEIGHWLVAEINVGNNSTNWYVSQERI